MGLIDRTYFIGNDIVISNVQSTIVGEQVDCMIEDREPELLESVLGYTLYKAFKAGLLETTIEQKWVDLLQGVEYTSSNGKVRMWKGIVNNPGQNIDALLSLNVIPPVVVGRGNMYDPVSNVATIIIPPSLIGKEFVFIQRGIGELIKNTEYSVTGNILSLLGGVKFSAGDVYFYKHSTLGINTSTGIRKTSMIAYFVYWHWMKKIHTQTTTMGEAKTKNENSSNANPSFKMVDAWNRMVVCINDLMDFLNSNLIDYPEFNDMNKYEILYKYRPLNKLLIG
jgi:hypothetical protein